MSKSKGPVLKRKDEFQVIGPRVLIAPMETEVESVTEAGIILPDSVREELKRNRSKILMTGEVVSIGKEVDKVSVGDVVYVFPTQFQADIVINGYTYLIYPESLLMGKVKTKNDE